MTATESPDLEVVAEALGGQAPVTTGRGEAAVGDGMPAWVGGVIGFVVLVVLWEVLAVTVFHKAGSGVPTPTSVVAKFWSDFHAGLYGPNVRQTFKEATTGYVVANALAIVLAVAFVQVPLVEKALLRVAIASYCLPIIAIGPILTFVLHGDAPKSALAGLLVFFPTLVGVVVGLRSTSSGPREAARGPSCSRCASGPPSRAPSPPFRSQLPRPFWAPWSGSTWAPRTTGSES